MKFRTEIVIDEDLQTCIDLFADQSQNALWQPEFMNHQPDKFKSDMSHHQYRVNGRMVGVNIQIVKDNLPENYETFTEMKGLTIEVQHVFANLTNGKILWQMESNFKPQSFMLKAIFAVMPNLMKNRTNLYMANFKKFAESKPLVSKL